MQHGAFVETDPAAQRLCIVLEKCLQFQIKDGIFSRTFFWDYVQLLDECVPDGKRVINLVKRYASTPHGRSRIFLRVALNEGALAEYLSALVWGHHPQYDVRMVSAMRALTVPSANSTTSTASSARRKSETYS